VLPDPAAFQTQPAGLLGNATRYNPAVRAFPNFNENVSLGKSFLLTERFKLDFRAEAFNLFNRVVFSAPATLNINSTALERLHRSPIRRARCNSGSNSTGKNHVAFEFVAQPEEREADKKKADCDRPAIENDAAPPARRLVRIDEPIRIPVDDGSA
jgi:hypothetical protein